MEIRTRFEKVISDKETTIVKNRFFFEGKPSRVTQTLIDLIQELHKGTIIEIEIIDYSKVDETNSTVIMIKDLLEKIR